MKELIIEAGKPYKNILGQSVYVYATPETTGDNYHGAYRVNGHSFVCQFCKEWIESEWVEPHQAESWPVDMPILVRDREDGEWYKSHFAEFKNGLVFAFSLGKTSWSNGKDRVCGWKYAKPASEAES